MLAVLAAIALTLVFASSALAVEGGRITGTVTSAASGEPIAGVEVCRDEDAEVSCVTTGSAGEYDLGETWGTIEFIAPAGSGYVHRSYFDGKYIAGEAETVYAPTTVDARLPAGGTIGGVVTNASTKAPIEGIEVCVSPVAAWPEEPTCVSTDAHGVYEIPGLAPVQYRVKFNPGALNYLPETPQREYKQYPQVLAGSTTANVDVALPEGAQIEGLLKSAATGLPIAGVQACATGFGPALETRCATTDAQGRYSIDGLESSSYYMSFWPKRPYVAQRYQAGKPMWVNQGETLSGVDASLLTGATISGVVRSATGGYPLQAVEVCLSEHVVEEFDGMAPKEESSGYCTEPNSAGEYHLDGIATSTDIVQFLPKSNAYDYEEQYWNNAATETEATQLHTTAGENITGINAALVPWHGVIAGRVTSYLGGQGVAGAEVCARTAAGDSWPPPDCVHANTQGEYQISVPRGSYNVEFANPPQSQLYVPEFYDGKLSEREAAPVTVSDGSTTGGIDAELVERTTPGAIIAGVVSNAASQQPIAGIEVCAYEASEEEDLFGRCTTTESDGKYSILGLFSGKYTVEFSSPSNSGLNYVAQYYDDATSPGKATTVTLDSETVALSIDAQLSEGGRIAGEVTDASTKAAVEGIGVCAFSEGAESFGCASTDSKGEYTISALAGGEYEVEFFSPPDGGLDYVAQYYDGEHKPSAANAVPVVDGSTTQNIEAALERGGRIEGEVTTATTKSAMRDVLVCALVSITESAGCGVTNAHGEYTIPGLAAGSYRVGFDAGKSYVIQYYNDKLSFSGAEGVPVAVDTDTTGIDASMDSVAPTSPPSPPLKDHSSEAPPPVFGQPSSPANDPGTPTPPSESGGEASTPILATAKPSPVVTTSSSTLVVSGGAADLHLRCSQAICIGLTELTIQVITQRHDGKKTVSHRETLVLAKGSFSLTEGKNATAVLRLTAAGKRRLAQAKHHPLAAELICTVQGGKTITKAVMAS
jgi:hypothetical protein